MKGPDKISDPRVVLHWYDFICPFCYIGQKRNEILVQHSLDVFEFPFQAHREIPVDGIAVGRRNGLMYTRLEAEAKEAGLPLHWPSHLPNSRDALAAAEWTRRYQPSAFSTLRSKLFEAHFALGQDIGDRRVVVRHARVSGIEVEALHNALADGSAAEFVSESEERGQRYGVQGTPAWFLNGQLILGLRSAADFELFAEQAITMAKQHAPSD